MERLGMAGFSMVAPIYKLNADGTGFTTLYSFPTPLPTDVIAPSGLALIGNSLYGTTEHTIFKINTDGSGFATLYTFAPVVGSYQTNQDGAFPWADLTAAGNSLYGTTSAGGIWGNGTIFRFSAPTAPLEPAISPYGQGAILTWPTNGLRLECTTNLDSPVWTPVASGTTIINGRNTVTNPPSGPQQFFRLSR